MLTPWDPLGYKVSHFRQGRRLTLAVSQAAGPLWEFRWGVSTALCYVTRITLKGVQTANASSEELRFNATIARTFTAADSVNVASILRGTNMQKLNTAFTASKLSNFVESNAAAAASGGTLTQDTDPIALGSYVTLATASTSNDGAADTIFDFQPFWDGDQALRLNQNEGFVVNLEATKGATAGFVLYLEVCWVEATKP